jgi:crossover junction endodeoxyribonuclease RusA
MSQNSETVFDFTVPGDPVPKARPRVFRSNTVTPARTIVAEDRVLQAFVRKYGYPKPLQGPVSISCWFYMASRRRKDFDNLVKLVTDALNGVAFVDDSQVTRALIVKILPVEGRTVEPRTEVRIEPDATGGEGR